MAENLTNDSTNLTTTTTEPKTSSLLDVEIPERPQRIPGFISTMFGFDESVKAIDTYLQEEGFDPLIKDEELDLEIYYLTFGNLFGIPKARTVSVYNRITQEKIVKTFRMRQ